MTIVDKNNENNSTKNFQGQDIVYAGDAQSNENSPDQFQNELPPRGDLSQYRAEQPDQFYHELPRGRYTNDPSRPPSTFHVQTKSNGEPTEDPYYGDEEAEVVEIGRNSTNNQNNQTSYGNNQQARLIQLYTDNDGISEVGQTEDQANARYSNPDNGNRHAQYQDVGNVRARVVSVTPPPATAIPTETVNRRRIVVSKPVTTVQEVVEADNSTNGSQRGNYRSDYVDGNGGNQDNQHFNNGNNDRNQNNFESNSHNSNGASGNYQNDNGYNGNYNSEQSANYRSGENNNGNYHQANNDGNDSDRNYNGGSQSKKANYESTPSTSTGVFISTTPSTASQRIIYVQPVSQNFAQQKAIPPKKQ